MTLKKAEMRLAEKEGKRKYGVDIIKVYDILK